jgi:hypothetical protein
MPIGGVAAYRDMVSPSGVGYDIGCGVMAVRTPLTLDDIRPDLGRLADAIGTRISFGLGRKNETPVDHELFDSPIWGEIPELTEKVAGRKHSWSLRARRRSSARSGAAIITSTCWSSPPTGPSGRPATSAAGASATGSRPDSSTWPGTGASSRRCRRASRCTPPRRCSR